jgi:hypothetical protein
MKEFKMIVIKNFRGAGFGSFFDSQGDGQETSGIFYFQSLRGVQWRFDFILLMDASNGC